MFYSYNEELYRHENILFNKKPLFVMNIQKTGISTCISFKQAAYLCVDLRKVIS